LITVVSATNRNNSKTQKLSLIIMDKLEKMGIEAKLCDLNQLPKDLFVPEHYWNTPESFKPFQEMILQADGIINVIPEYNGSFPGVYKYFIDLLKFPDSLRHKPAGFIGLASGYFGAVRSTEQAEMIYQYREAHIFGRRVFFPGIEDKLSEDLKSITDERLEKKLDVFLKEFNVFAHCLSEKLPLS
jgi:chromate reductase